MEQLSITDRYQRLNNSYSPVLVWHTGVDAGFFAEYSAMLNAMLFCLERRWQFRLYSADANYGYRRGWTDYFMPFCPEETAVFHHRLNHYSPATWRQLLCRRDSRRFQTLAWKAKLSLRHAAGRLLALVTYGRNVRLSADVRFVPKAHYRIPELDIDGDYFHAFGRMADITWHLNAATAVERDALVASLGLGSDYAGCQVRGGDKVTETALQPPERYAATMRRLAAGRDVFVLTDDYAIYRRLCAAAPDVRFLTLCEPSEGGYVNTDFTHTGADLKRRRMERFLTAMDLLMHARPFVGSITNGPSFFLLKKRYPDAVAIDCPADRLREALTGSIAERSRIARQTLGL